MLPSSSPSCPEKQIKKSRPPADHGPVKKSLQGSLASVVLSSKGHIHPGKKKNCILVSVLFIQFVVLLALPLLLPLHSYFHIRRYRHHKPIASAIAADDEQCDGPGRVYVYDIPSEFNADLIRDYPSSNEGFGLSAEASFSGELPRRLASSWYQTEQFALEILFHNRMLNHRCRTQSPENATAFYVPFYGGLAVAKALFNKSASLEDLDRSCKRILAWLGGQPYFRRTSGSDHFMTLGRISWDFRRSILSTWGSSCFYQPLMRNVTRLMIERHPWDEFDVGVPYPTGFHPATEAELTDWQNFVSSKPRRTLFTFAGARRAHYKNDFRGLLLNHCDEEAAHCRAVDCSELKCKNGSSAIIEAFLDSKFCLQPRGDSFTRKSVFDCMVTGSVPVFFWRRTAYLQYKWFLPSDPESYSVFIHRDGVKNGTVNIRAALQKYGEEDIRRMRAKLVEVMPRIIYGKRKTGIDGVRDAVDVAVVGVLRRFSEGNESNYRL